MSPRATAVRGPALVDAVLLCYPRAWRRRYADEVLSLALSMHADGVSRWRTLLDLVRAAPAAWMQTPEQNVGTSRSRAITLSAWALLALLVGGAGFAKLQDDVLLMRATGASGLATWGFRCAVAGGLGAGAVTLLAALPSVAALVRLGRPGTRLLARLAVLPAAALAGLGVLKLAAALVAGHDVHAWVTRVVAGVVALLLLGMGALVAVVVANVARRVPEATWTTRARSLGVCGLAGSALVTTVGTALWWVGVSRQQPGMLDRHAGLLSEPLWSSLVGTAPFVLAAVVLSSLAARAAWSGTARDRLRMPRV